MIGHDRADVFFGLITPHGLLELTAVFVASAAGLRLGWSWIVPGPRTRMQALAQTGRATVGMAIGLPAILLITGLIEAFVTPSPLPTAVRVGIGVLAEVGFLVYVWIARASRCARRASTATSNWLTERPAHPSPPSTPFGPGYEVPMRTAQQAQTEPPVRRIDHRRSDRVRRGTPARRVDRPATRLGTAPRRRRPRRAPCRISPVSRSAASCSGSSPSACSPW